MTHSKETLHLASTIVSHYARFDRLSRCYVLDICDVADFDLHEMCASLMKDNSSLSTEATGFDNPAYETSMLPAMIRWLENTTDKDSRIEFEAAWREGILSYFKDIINDLLENELQDYNSDRGYVAEDQGRKRDASLPTYFNERAL
jgi:hypothetical protein